MAVTANITVQFGSSEAASGDGHLSAEVDSRPTGLNATSSGSAGIGTGTSEAKTTFAPGETAYFLVYRSDNVTIDSVVSSAGSIVTATPGASVTKEDDLTFADTDTATLSIPASAVGTVTWYGRSLGSLTLQPDGMTVKASASGVGVCKVSYTAKNVSAYGLRSPTSAGGETDFSILVLVKGNITE